MKQTPFKSVSGLTSFVLAAMLSTATGSTPDPEPGTIDRNGTNVFQPAAPELSDYFIPGTESLFAPLRTAGTQAHGVVVWGEYWEDLWAHTEDINGTQVAIYQDFLTAMGYTPGDDAVVWPTNQSGVRVPYLGATSFSELFGTSLSRAYRHSYSYHEQSPDGTDIGHALYGFPRVAPTGDVDVPPSYPPTTSDISASNSPLVPATVAGVPRKFYTTRETLGGELDLITGQPLLRDIDLEIAFGGAVFRRIRTYSETPHVGINIHEREDAGSNVRSRSAGWHGTGWMSSDAPMFLIDSASYNTNVVVKDGRVTEPRCIFAPDAHHSIPFVRQVSPALTGEGNAGNYNVDYVAPSWFDAILTHKGGVWNNDRRDWDVYPSEFKVILNKRSVIYTIKPVYEDVSPAENRLPIGDYGWPEPDLEKSGWGNPYYGLVTSIKDRAGNRVEFDYAEGHEPFDGPIWQKLVEDALPDGTPAVWGDYLQYTQQRGWYKGMIDSIKLYPAGENEAAWTLLYTYRAFAAARSEVRKWNFWDRESFAPALHSILAYEQDVDTSILVDRNLILKCHEEPDLSPCDPPPPPPPLGEEESDGQFVDASTIDVIPDGNSSTAIDHVSLGGGGIVLTADSYASPPFQELLIEDPIDYCRSPFVPVPISTGFANQYDYQDELIGPAGEGPDSGSWSVMPSNWEMQVSFSYAPPSQYNSSAGYTADTDYALAASGPVSTDFGDLYTGGQAPNPSSYFVPARSCSIYLLKTRTTIRDLDSASAGQAGDPVASESSYHLYRYQDVDGPGSETLPYRYRTDSTNAGPRYAEWSRSQWEGGASPIIHRRLSLRFRPRDVDAMASKELWVNTHGSKNEYVNHLIGQDEDELIPALTSNAQTGPSTQPLFRAAGSSFYRWSEPYRFRDIQTDQTNGTTYKGVAYPASWVAYDGQISSGSMPSTFVEDLWDNYLGTASTGACPDIEINQVPRDRTAFLPEGTSVFASKNQHGTQRWFRLHRYLVTPDDEAAWRGDLLRTSALGGIDPNDTAQQDFVQFRGPELVTRTFQGSAEAATKAIYHYPFRFVARRWDGPTGAASGHGHTQLERKDPMWWAVIDEYDTLDEALSVGSSLSHTSTANGRPWITVNAEFAETADWKSRRVVAMNPAGLVLSDRTWDADDGTSTPPAIMEAYVYDDHMRLTMLMSRGWGSARADSAVNEGDEGRVDVFTYDPVTEENIDPDEQPNTGDEYVRLNIPREIKSSWLNKGCLTPNSLTHPSYVDENGPVAELALTDRIYYRDVFPNAPEYLADQIYSQLVYDLNGQPGLASQEHRVEYWDSALPGFEDDFDPENPPIKWELNAGEQFRRDPTKPLQYGVSINFYNRSGQLVWTVNGAMESILDGTASGSINGDVLFTISPDDELFLNYRQYDGEGREFIAIEDIDLRSGIVTIESGSGFNYNDMAFPAGMQQEHPVNELDPHGVLFLGERESLDDVEPDRLGTNDGLIAFWSQINEDIILLNGLHRQAEAKALDHITYREFSRFGPTKVVYPTGARDLFEYRLESDYFKQLEAFGVEFNGEAWKFAGQNLYDKSFSGQQFVENIQGAIDDLEADQWDGAPYSLDADIFRENRLRVVAEMTPNYDGAGQMTSMKMSDPSGEAEPIEQFIAHDGWGNPLRNQDADGAISRMMYDQLGRLHKTFKGSRDRHDVWGTSDITSSDDDMFLVEKLHYGLGKNDAGEVTHRYSFRSKSAQQYGADLDEPSEGPTTSGYFVAGGSGTDETSSGLLEEYEYDWRMRRVITRYLGLDSAQGNTHVIREERVFLDNAGRERFSAVYDGLANGSSPHPSIVPGNILPQASDFYQCTLANNLLSLRETIYNGAGQTVEARRYDPAWDPSSGTSGFLVTHTFTDHGNRPTWARDDGQRISRNVYDAKGRLAWSSTWAGDLEISRTTNFYGPADTVDVMQHWERVDTSDTASGQLESAGVAKRVSVSYQWFDRNKRLIASVDFGTEDHSGTIDGYGFPSRPAETPIVLEDLPMAPPVGDGPVGSPMRQLVGVIFEQNWFDANGQGNAKVSAQWYGPLGQTNAMLTLLSATKNAAGDVDLQYTIDRTERNNFGQTVLEHRYGYSEAIPSGSTSGSRQAEFLGGMAYSYTLTGWDDPQDPADPPMFNGTKVREIIPLVDGHHIRYEDDIRRYVLDESMSTEPFRKTVLEYNAPIVEPGFTLPSYVLHPAPDYQYNFPIDSNDWGHLGVSNRPDLVKAVHTPNPTTGATGNGLGYSLFYFYYADGLPAVRLDSRGIAIHYTYDHFGNVTKIRCDDSNMPLVDSLELIDSQLPSNAIDYGYDAYDRLVLARTGRNYNGTDAAMERVDTESVLEYDRLGSLTKEYQSRGGSVDVATTGFVGYDYERVYATNDYSNGLPTRDNINRISAMTYPARLGTHDGGTHSPRTLHFGYGQLGKTSDLTNRVETITASGGPAGAPLTNIADYRYSGLGRLEEVRLGTPASEPVTSTENILRDIRTFDGFGRVADRDIDSWDGVSAYRDVMLSEFGYDIGNRRVFERLTQADFDGQSRDNTHSVFYQHDLDGRLVGEHYGTLLSDGFDGIDTAATVSRVQSYLLDQLNRRVGDPDPGTFAPGISIWEDTDLDGLEDAGESLLAHEQVVDHRGGLTGLDDGSATTTIGQDSAGAITSYDGRDIYYDWLGRPVLVLESGTRDAVVAYAYDGFGRLAKRIAPWPQYPSQNFERVEDYYYDGVRRIQEVFHDPMEATPPWPSQNRGGGGVFGGGTQIVAEARTEAEYIWSAASGQPFDTCHVQIDWWDREAWFVQDHSTGTMRAYVDSDGEIAEQYRFDAFGNLIEREAFPIVTTSAGYYKSFRQRLGHHGMFADRLDGTTQSRTIESSGAEVWYQSRSRWYAPELGRFATPDPNATGVPVQSSLAMLGKMPAGPPAGGFDHQSHYGDGGDVFTAYAGSPIQTQDPTGLFFVGLAGGGSAAMDIYADYADETLSTGSAAAGYVNNQLGGIGQAQLAAVDLILDWGVSSSSLMGINAGGATFSSSSSVNLAMRWGGAAKSWATAAMSGADRHHIIPRFLMGQDSLVNRLDMKRSDHRSLHREISAAFKGSDLPAPHTNSRSRSTFGGKGKGLTWKAMFDRGLVDASMLTRAQSALVKGCENFDAKNKGYSVAPRVRNLMFDSQAVSAAGRLVRHGGRIR